ncbi:MAG TPA: hypothetical protein VF403_16810 [Kofleriaceae bacterium]
MGEFGVIAIRGGLHVYDGERDGKPLVEFTWEGAMMTAMPRAVAGGDDRADGMMGGRFFIHRADDGGFVAEQVVRR